MLDSWDGSGRDPPNEVDSSRILIYIYIWQLVLEVADFWFWKKARKFPLSVVPWQYTDRDKSGELSFFHGTGGGVFGKIILMALQSSLPLSH